MRYESCGHGERLSWYDYRRTFECEAATRSGERISKGATRDVRMDGKRKKKSLWDEHLNTSFDLLPSGKLT